MTDSKFTAEYKYSVTDVIENVVLPTDYKSKILSALREQAKKEEADKTETPAETIDTQETASENTEVISIESAKQNKKSIKQYIAILSGIAAAIVVVVSVLLINYMGTGIYTGTGIAPATKNLNFTVASATNLKSVQGAQVTFCNSDGEVIRNKDGTPVTAYTDEKGNIAVNLPEADSYVAVVSADGYITYESIVYGPYIYISPVMDENTYRAVLTWENNCDLDAILTVTQGDKTEQLFYFNSNIYNENDELIAALDTDSATPGAPETITFNATDEGVFRFSVAAYSSLSSKTPELGNSKATVTLYKGEQVADSFTIKPETRDNVWCVLEVRNSEIYIIDSTYTVDAIPEVY